MTERSSGTLVAIGGLLIAACALAQPGTLPVVVTADVILTPSAEVNLTPPG
jgi:hypothetical protein